jgi:hypothetical protein
MKRIVALAAVCALTMTAPLIGAHHGGPFNGAGAWDPGNGWDAPIFRQFAFVEGTVTLYHVLTPETLLMDQHRSLIYQFPACMTLRPVLQAHHPSPGDGGYWEPHDAPTREIVDVVLSTGCAKQPQSEAEVWAMAAHIQHRGLWVNAPVIPEQLAELPDDRLFNGPPYRPRVTAFMEGEEVTFITYETSWHPSWVGTNFPSTDADVFIISYGAIFRPDFTIINVAAGSPHHATFRSYSPIWRANCIVDALNEKCMVSVNKQAGYEQCYNVATCTNMVNPHTGLQVEIKRANTFTHINCPMVAVDLNGDHYIDPWEELVFPNLWTNGPVIA